MGWVALVWRGCPVANQPGVVFGNHRPWAWLSDLPATMCCSSVIITFRYCACSSGWASSYHPCCSSSAPPRWYQERASRNKSILECLIPTDDKNNINSNNKYLVSAYYYSFNYWPFHSWPWQETCSNLHLRRYDDTCGQTYWHILAVIAGITCLPRAGLRERGKHKTYLSHCSVSSPAKVLVLLRPASLATKKEVFRSQDVFNNNIH